MTQDEAFERLKAHVERDGRATVTGRDLLSWVGAERRGSEVVRRIRQALWSHGLATEPDFNAVWIDEPIDAVSASPPLSAAIADSPTTEPPPNGKDSEPPPAVRPPPIEADIEADIQIEKTMRSVGRLEAANAMSTNNLHTIAETAKLIEATTEMRLHGLDHLVVLRHREPIGVVTWKAIAEAALRGPNAKLPELVRDVMEAVLHVDYDTDISEAIERMDKSGYVLVRNKDRTSGLVTFRDIGTWFREQFEAFIVLGDVERALRSIARAFSLDEIRSALDATHVGEIGDVSDLTFGALLRLLDEPTRWARLGLGLDRVKTIAAIDDARKGRNAIVHLAVDSVEQKKVVAWRRLAKELERAAATRG